MAAELAGRSAEFLQPQRQAFTHANERRRKPGSCPWLPQVVPRELHRPLHPSRRPVVRCVCAQSGSLWGLRFPPSPTSSGGLEAQECHSFPSRDLRVHICTGGIRLKSFMELPSRFWSHRSPGHSPFPGTDAELHFIGMLSVHSIALRCIHRYVNVS
ncbi:uncharacterized protein LOC110305147 [Mus caroli]|uniref:Uncharacterized protein LOC110305147 n=1 Tax=Mus caroli TaxID=10089 RepID=A0A6P7R3Q8_MUSCR|nr:uncharacterized protein LOC110305147 [Mus caroli]